MVLNLDPNWRRTVLALVFAAAGAMLILMALWLVHHVLADSWPPALAGRRLTIVGNALYATLALLALVLASLGMTVALRQVSAKFAGSELSMSGGSDAAPSTSADARSS